MSASTTAASNATNNAQKDYHSLNNHNGNHQHPHQHLNRLKSSSNGSINASGNPGCTSPGGSSLLSNGGNSVNGSKRSSLIIGDANCGGIDQLQQLQQPPQQQQHKPIHHLHQLLPVQKTTVTNGMFVMNPFRQTHLHHHQRGSNNNSSLSSGSSISSNMRKSYPSSDPSNSSFSSASVAGSIQDDNMSDQCSSTGGLTQAGLEEYNSRSYYDQPVFHHQKQSSYAQSEGYHSYVSSSDSSSATPFLDRLRQETELLSRQSHHWSQNDLSSPSSANNNSTGCPTNPTIDNNSNESTSSTETLKWLGSTSDISVASHATNSSAISGSVSSSSQLIAHSSRVLTPKRHNSESVLYMNDDQMSVTSDSNVVNCNKTSIIYQQQHSHPHQHYHPPLPPPIANHHKSSGVDHHPSHHHHHQQNSSSVASPPASSLGGGSTPSPGSLPSSTPSSPTSVSSPSATVTLTANSTASATSPTSSTSSYRNNHRLFPVGTYAERVNGTTTVDYQQIQHQHHHQQPQTAQPQQLNGPQQPLSPIKLPSPQSHNWQSVADRISDFERQQQHLSSTANVHHHHNHPQQPPLLSQQQKYTFIDPSKTHRVPNPALKAFQKNAVQSYFERQQQHVFKDTPNKAQQPPPLPPPNPGQPIRPQSLQLPNSPKEVFAPQMRSSLPNNCPGFSGHKVPSAQQIINSSHLRSPVNDDCSPYIECNSGPPPPPPPRSRSLMPVRRSSSASEYAEFRESFMRTREKPSLSTVTSPEKLSFNDCGVPPPPPPPPRGRVSMPVRRTSSASEYVAFREKNLKVRQNLVKEFNGAMIMGPIISLDDWVPERPPKNPNLRIPSPDLPPPPLQAVDIETNLPNQDEPLPPPPPEILRHVRQSSDGDQRPPPQSRRNSFAGSPSQKPLYRVSTLENLSPPIIPKKPSAIDLMHVRSASSMAHSHKAHKVILNGKLESPTSPTGPRSPGPPRTPEPPLARMLDPRASVRKRSHNSYPTPPPSVDTKPSSPGMKLSNPPMGLKSPPPLKPRMPIAGQEMRTSPVAISCKLRRNSKASYLPRQTTDKLINATDPDHGSYKLTLTSNEDSINHSTSSFHDDILSSKCNNLPDVLPVGVKMQSSPSSSSSSSPRYGSNNNINLVTPPHTAPAMISGSYPMKSMFHFQPPAQALHPHHHNGRLSGSPISTSPPSYSMAALNRSTSSPMNSNDSISPKYMSQSTIDLKKTHIFEAAEESAKMLSPAQSESNIIAHDKPRSPYSAKREFRKSEVVRKLSLEDQNKDEGRIVRAELVNTVFSSSPPTPKMEEKAIRKDSLRGNIEKITQLQSKLMSAHLLENGTDRTLLGFTAKTVEIKSKITEREMYRSAEPKSLISSPNKSLSSPVPETPESERISKMDSELDGLKLMQRTEIILRLNAPTVEAASQTDETLEAELSRIKLGDSPKGPSYESKPEDFKPPPPIELKPREKHQEEIECDNLSTDLASQLAASDKLHQILAPKIFKSTQDYVSGLYNPKIMPRSIKRDVGTSTPGSVETLNSVSDHQKSDQSVGCEMKKSINLEASGKLENTKHLVNGTSNGVLEAKGKISTRYSQEVKLVNGGDSGDLTKKKEDLVNRITKKLLVLGNDQTTIAEETSTNDHLGVELVTKVADKLRPIDITKFRAYIDDVGHITMLLLSLSGRLAKVENALQTDIENSAEKKILEVKRDRLIEQLEEAKRLKEDINRRGTIVSKILEKNLTAEEYADYDYFINMKAKLIVDSRENADKIKVGEEQLKALKDTLIQSEC